MTKEMIEILYGDMEEEQIEFLVKTKDVRYADKTFWKTRKELEKSLNLITEKSKDMFGKPDMILVNPGMRSLINDLANSLYTVDKDKKKK